MPSQTDSRNVKKDFLFISIEQLFMKGFEELASVQDKKARIQIWHEAFSESLRSSWGIRALALGLCFWSTSMLSLYILVLVTYDWMHRTGSWSYVFVGLCAGILGVGSSIVAGLLATIFMRNRIRQGIWRRMGDAGYPICRACGYSLHGLRGHKCPECGEWFTIEQVENWRGEPIETPTFSNASES